MSSRWVLSSHEACPERDAQRIGTKAAQLLKLIASGHPVPPFFVVSVAALQSLVGDFSPTDVDQHALRERFRSICIPPELKTAILQARSEVIPAGTTLAVRSSSTAEDQLQHSFAGIHRTILGVRDPDDLLDAIRQVWQSVVSDSATAYRTRLQLPPIDCNMAVIVQQMIDARQSGVCFTRNPLTGATHEILIHAVPGVGEGLVGHSFAADSYVVAKESLAITAQVAVKDEQLLLNVSDGGLRQTAIDTARQSESSLSNDQVQQVARAALKIEQDFGCSQDIEFCFDARGDLFIVQSRPVTSVATSKTADTASAEVGNPLVWDNSNIIESYSGVTSPMTFSFICRAYSIVYRCFAEVMGISPRVVHAHQDAFDNMLGFFRGRVYYNLRNWYRLVRLFPGYQYNRRFMESMMGLKDPLLLEDEARPPGFWRRWLIEFPSLLKLLTRSSCNFLLIRRKVASFEANFQQHYDAWSEVDFDALPPHEVMAAYNTLEGALLWNWKAPIINDFYVMIFYGVLKKLCSNWCHDTSGGLQNGLICGEGGLQSDEPAKMLLQMADLAAHNPPLRQCILNEPLETLPAIIAHDSRFLEFNTLMATYLREYGLRCVGELKLETVSWRDQPHRVYQVLRDYLQRDMQTSTRRADIEQRERERRSEAERQCLQALSQSSTGWLRKRIFRRVLKNARLGIRQRENMRFARTRIYGILRSMLRSIGKHFAASDVLDDREDIFYLTIDEVWGFIRGTAVSTDLRGLAAVRRAEYDRYRDGTEPAPADRFVTYGMACHPGSYRSAAPAAESTDGAALTGIGCCPGVVCGTVQIIRDPADSGGFEGDILVAERTDPGWVTLYPGFKGILIERGSVLSHSAIVAREMGIPTIVGIAQLTKRLASGQQVRMDGQAGTVEIIRAT
jgi:phosphohistidine swiveling domain-containing protein